MKVTYLPLPSGEGRGEGMLTQILPTNYPGESREGWTNSSLEGRSRSLFSVVFVASMPLKPRAPFTTVTGLREGRRSHEMGPGSFPETGAGSGLRKSFTKLSHSRGWSPRLEMPVRDEQVRDPRPTSFLKAEKVLVREKHDLRGMNRALSALTPTLSRGERETA
jgi:hypothetical protein